MESDDTVTHFQSPTRGYQSLDRDYGIEENRRHRFSALVDGICIGVGFVFLLLGVLMPIASSEMLVQGLLSIIGGTVILTTGVVVEVYHWARLLG